MIEAPVDRDLLTKRCTEEVVRFIRAHWDQPFFVYFAQPMPGSTPAPFASAAFKGKSSNGPWGDAIEEIDWSTGQILDTLTELEIDQRTLLVWLSDNGAPMKPDPGDLSRGTNRPLFGRGYTTSEGAFRTPTIMRWPGSVKPGTTCTEVASTLDLLPTFARLAGIEHMAQDVDGYDIRPLVFGQPGAKSPHEALFYYAEDQLQAVRSGPWKLFLSLDTFRQHPHFLRGEKSAPLLYHLVDDVGCTTNLAQEHPDVVRRLTDLAAAARADLGDRGQQGAGQRHPGRAQGDPQPLVMGQGGPGS